MKTVCWDCAAGLLADELFERLADDLRSRTESEKGCMMYEPFFGMERRPFSATPDPGCFYSSDELQAVLDELTVCVERGQGIGILTASAGMGKTLLCQRLAVELRKRDESDGRFECVCLSNSNFPTRRSLLQAILFEMGDEYSRRDEPELRLDLRSRLLSLRPEREALVLIVDEAHLFADELLEELRTMADIADNGSSLVRIILSGQHELEERLTERTFDALNQRISNHVFVESLTISESAEYIRHRLRWANCDPATVFSDEAISVITRASGGVPRCLNQLSDHSLLLAFASDQRPVSERTVREALEDLKQLPLHWNDISDGIAVVGYQEDSDGDTSFDEEVTACERSPDAAFESADLDGAGNAEDTDDNFDSEDPDNFAGAVSTGDSPEEADSTDDDRVVDSESSSQDASVKDGIPVGRVFLQPDGGFELDFSHVADHKSIAAISQNLNDDSSTNPVIGRSVENEVALPVTSVFEFSGENSTISDETDDVAESEPAADDETLLQDLRPAIDDALLESAVNTPGTRSDDESDVFDVGAGICFQISSHGFEIDGFGPPEKIETATESVNESRLLIEASELVESKTDDGISGEIPSSDEDFKLGAETGEASSDLVDSGVIAFFSDDESESEFGVDENSTAMTAEDATDEKATSHDESSQPAEVAFATFGIEGRSVTTKSRSGESGFEDELVFDPYAALQEPDTAGIVWNIRDFAASIPTEATAELPEAVELLISSETSCETDATGGEVLDQNCDSPEQDMPQLEVVSTGHREDVETAIEHECFDETVDDDPAVGLDEPVSVEDGQFNDVTAELRIREQAAESESSCADTESAVEFVHQECSDHGPSDRDYSTDEQEVHDVVQPVELRMLQPDRIVDSVLPLLSELDDELDFVGSPTSRGWSVLDIEAELIQTIEPRSTDIEDEIAATMLEICLDTQSALQDSLAALRKAEAEDVEPVEPNLSDANDEWDELPIEPFDIVQPETERPLRAKHYKLDPHFRDSSSNIPKSSKPTATSGQPSEQPFGRLFSDLRRRKN